MVLLPTTQTGYAKQGSDHFFIYQNTKKNTHL